MAESCRQFVGRCQLSPDEETRQQICSNPDPETAFNVMVKRRPAEVKVSTLSTEQRRELVEAKDKELNTLVKYSVVEAASRQGISPSAQMKMRWGVTFADDGQLKARLVVQGFTDHVQPHPVDLVRVDDSDDDDVKIESAQPVSDTFCGPAPELSRTLHLEHHRCVRLLKAVYGLVNAPRRWYHRVATDLRNTGG